MSSNILSLAQGSSQASCSQFFKAYNDEGDSEIVNIDTVIAAYFSDDLTLKAHGKGITVFYAGKRVHVNGSLQQ